MSLFNKAKFAALVMVTTIDSAVVRAENQIENSAFLEAMKEAEKEIEYDAAVDAAIAEQAAEMQAAEREYRPMQPEWERERARAIKMEKLAAQLTKEDWEKLKGEKLLFLKEDGTIGTMTDFLTIFDK